MASKLRSVTKKFIVFFNLPVAFIFLLACLAPYLNPAKWWFISFLGLGFAILLVLVVLFIFLWLIVYPRFIFISVLTLILGWKSISVFFAFNTPREFNISKAPGTLRVV